MAGGLTALYSLEPEPKHQKGQNHMSSELNWMFSTMPRLVAEAGNGGDVAQVRRAFDRFLDKLRAASELIDRPGMPADAISRADGFRNILITLHFAMDRVLGEASPHAPALGQVWPVHLFDWGGASPDSAYRSMAVTGGITYRITARFGNAPSTSLQFFDGQDICLTLTPDQFAQTAEGAEVHVGGPPRDGAWFPLPDGVTSALLREFFADWETAERSQIEVEALGVSADNWPQMSPDRVAHELDAIGEWVELTARFWADLLTSGYDAQPNGFTEYLIRDQGVPAIAWGYFNVPAGHAWIMEMPAPDTPFWSVQPGTIWWRTLDFVNRHSSLNNAQATIDEDGFFRAVFSHEDPGIANWIDLQGIERGAALIRVALPPASLIAPQGRLVPIGEVQQALPKTARIDPAERERLIGERRRQMRRLLLR
ncbi:MAG: hypothetical protein ABJA20_16405, partial [Novosphingobium sp.]